MNFIILQSPAVFHSIKLMAQHCYDRTADDSVVVIGTNNYPFSDFKKEKRLIVYQLEQLYNYGSQWFNPDHRSSLVRERTINIQQWLGAADEIWDYDQDNIEFLKSLGFDNVQFRPILPCDAIRLTVPDQRKEYDLIFWGTLNLRRIKLLQHIKRCIPHARIKIIGIAEARTPFRYHPPLHGAELELEIRKAKAVLNLHYYESALQEQVRLAPIVATGIPVISEKSRRNYFGEAVIEFSGDFTAKYRLLMR